MHCRYCSIQWSVVYPYKNCSCYNNITGANCADDDLSLNSKCYKKFHTSQLTWFAASNDCLSHGGSLAVFSDIGRPSNNIQLTNWLNRPTSGTVKTYWIGLVRHWWKTTSKSRFELLCSEFSDVTNFSLFTVERCPRDCD